MSRAPSDDRRRRRRGGRLGRDRVEGDQRPLGRRRGRRRARVRAVIDELGYESSLVAQSLRSRRTNVIGMLVVDIEPFSAELLKGVGAARSAAPGYELVVFSGCGRADDQVGWERRYLSRVSGTLCDGAILVTPSSVDVHATAHPSSPSTTTSARPSLPTRRLRQPERRRDGDRAPARARAPPDRLPRRPARPRVGAAARARLPPGARGGRDRARPVADPGRRLPAPRRPRRRRGSCSSCDDRPTAIFAANDVSAIAHDRGRPLARAARCPTTCR